MFERLRHRLHVARPRSITRMQKSLDDVVEGVRGLRVAVKEQGERDKRQQRETDALATQVLVRKAPGRDPERALAELTDMVCRYLVEDSRT